MVLVWAKGANSQKRMVAGMENRVAKKPRVCVRKVCKMGSQWVGFTSTHYIIYPKHWHNKKLIDDDLFQKSCLLSEKNSDSFLNIHSDLQFGMPNFTTVWGIFASFENFARRKVERFMQLWWKSLNEHEEQELNGVLSTKAYH